MYPSIFDTATTEAMLTRLEGISADTTPQWGKMNAGQMLAHLNVAYDITNGKLPVSYNPFMRLMLKMFVKKIVVGSKPYAKNGQTAPVFIIEGDRDFATEKAKLIANMNAVEAEGAAAYEGRVSPSFGKMSSQEWSNQFWKHMDHHFTQFGV
ncbi:DUF1569 domain-containing protein [Neolewinella agarilytica]|uniref:DUF1569 domain-containing protein n=1 Tax=Neolewinella agarilytica TaxID=478744 RepID=A0A1H9AN91_9BACT|nr:DUF1569 domain-containing protein [Neolewinella agarilytica]SEP77833.1 Protein of unknown function [Neolewinella agarilytica]